MRPLSLSDALGTPVPSPPCAANLLTRDEARRIAINRAKLPRNDPNTDERLAGKPNPGSQRQPGPTIAASSRANCGVWLTVANQRNLNNARANNSAGLTIIKGEAMAEKQSESVYRIIDVVGVSETSWEDAGRKAVETAAGSLRDLRVAEVTKMDMKVDNGKVTAFRTRVALSFVYKTE